jgi:(S)-mandelate dehydrogenase
MLPAVKDYRALAGRRLARFAFDYLEGGAEDGRTLARNRAAFETLLFRPRALQDVAEVDAGVELFGRRQAMPALVGPTGLNGLYWPRAEEALAQRARDAGVPFVLSTASNSLLEDVRAASDGELWLQLYVQRERRDRREHDGARQGGRLPRADAHRRHDGPRQARPRRAQRLPHPGAVDAAPARRRRHASALVPAHAAPGRLAAVRQPREERRPLARPEPRRGAMSRQMDMSLTWADLAWVRRHWDGR